MLNFLTVSLKEGRTYMQLKTNMSENKYHIYHHYRVRFCNKSHILKHLGCFSLTLKIPIEHYHCDVS